MKTTYTHILIGLLAGGAVMMARAVTIPKTFTPNTTAKAEEVNANFTALGSAVNDNDGKITTNKTAIQTNANDIATNTNDIQTNVAAIQANETAIGKKVSEVKVARGLMVDRADGNVTIKLPDGYVAVHGSAFNVSDEVGSDCMMVRDQNGIYFHAFTSYDGCKAYATVEVPVAAQLDKMECRVKHADSTSDTVITLYHRYTYRARGSFTTTFKSKKMIAMKFDNATTADFQVKSQDYSPSAPSIGGGSVAVGTFGYSSYVLEWAPSKTSSAGQKEILYDCAVYYKY